MKEKLEHSIMRQLSDLIPTLKDPRIPLVVTVEKINLSKDSKSAKVLVSTLEEKDIQGMLEALTRASGYLQHQLAEVLELRFTPRLSFHVSPLEVLS
jgi:ribosome-binding factor A